jgi:hypothetical protein
MFCGELRVIRWTCAGELCTDWVARCCRAHCKEQAFQSSPPQLLPSVLCSGIYVCSIVLVGVQCRPFCRSTSFAFQVDSSWFGWRTAPWWLPSVLHQTSPHARVTTKMKCSTPSIHTVCHRICSRIDFCQPLLHGQSPQLLPPASLPTPEPPQAANPTPPMQAGPPADQGVCIR